MSQSVAPRLHQHMTVSLSFSKQTGFGIKKKYFQSVWALKLRKIASIQPKQKYRKLWLSTIGEMQWKTSHDRTHVWWNISPSVRLQAHVALVIQQTSFPLWFFRCKLHFIRFAYFWFPYQPVWQWIFNVFLLPQQKVQNMWNLNNIFWKAFKDFATMNELPAAWIMFFT